MAFKGDTSQITLSNIFQTLQLNGQEGVMTVASGKARRKVRVVPGGVRLLSLSRDSLDVLRIALVKQKIVTGPQFQNILSTMGQSSTYPGDFLVQRRILSVEQVDNEVAKQFGELIYEIFSWKKAKYEFNTGDLGDELELFDPNGLGQNLVFNINSILMEAARRDDDWQRIRAVIRSEHEIFSPVNLRTFREPRKYESEIDVRSIEEVKNLVDGQRTVEAIISQSTLSAFEAFKILALLLANQEIRPLSIEEKKELAEDLRKKFKSTEVIEIYQNLLSSDPLDIDTRLKLVPLLEKRKDISPLIEQYQCLADYFYGTYEYAPARNYLSQILRIDPHHIGALEKLFELHYHQKSNKDALQVARKLVEAVKTTKEFARGADILLKVVDLYPGETFLFHQLADFFIFSNQTDNAVSCLKSVATLYEERGDLTRLRKTYERIAAIDPSEVHTLRKIADAERRTVQPVQSWAVRIRTLTWATLGALVILGAGYLLAMEIMGRKAYASVRGDSKACADAGDFRRAREILEDIARRFPLSTLPSQVAEEVNELISRERERDAQLRRNEERENIHFGSFQARVESLMSSKRYLEALKVVLETNQSGLNESNRRKLAAIQVEIQKIFAAADELLQRGREQIQTGKHEEAHRTFLKLLESHPNTPASQGLKLPLLVKTAPAGAKVVLSGEPAGTTPLTVYYDPLAKLNLSISKDGFRSVTLADDGERRIDFTKDWMVLVRLERIPAWIFDAKAPVECTPLVLKNKVYFGTRGGRIFCLELATGKERWTFPTPDGWDVASGIQTFRDRICFGTFDGAFHVLQTETGRPLHRLVPLSPPRPIRHAASEPSEKGIVAVNCGGTAVGVNIMTGALAWTFRGEADVLGSPELHQGALVATTQDGVVQILEPDTGTLIRRLPLGVRIQVPGKVAEGSYLVGDTAGRILRINLETGAIQWIYESPMENLTSPAIGSDLVFFGSRGGLIAALNLRTGDLRWRGKANDGLYTPATWYSGNFYLGTKAGQGLCLEAATGTPIWSFPTGGPCDAAPGAGGGLVLFPCDDHRVYAFQEP